MLGKDNAITLRQAFDTLRGPPVTSLRHAFDPLRGPPLSSPFRELRELTERMHAGADLRMLDVHAPPQPSQHAPAPTAHRGAPLIHDWRSEEHTSELQSRPHLVCRLLLEKKKKNSSQINNYTKEPNQNKHP